MVSDFSRPDDHVTIIKPWNNATIVTRSRRTEDRVSLGTMSSEARWGSNDHNEDFTPQYAQPEHSVEPWTALSNPAVSSNGPRMTDPASHVDDTPAQSPNSEHTQATAQITSTVHAN